MKQIVLILRIYSTNYERWVEVVSKDKSLSFLGIGKFTILTHSTIIII